MGEGVNQGDGAARPHPAQPFDRVVVEMAFAHKARQDGGLEVNRRLWLCLPQRHDSVSLVPA
ncbi:hypothetical protein D3874_27390 [Oleomonas cavernae]|uniref:Uncharacterized protein n=1 Tax=Oleomonas cavernae TaxID=2320859 RepID=A0A418VUH1_9PROT|nr:hypothetical protein D3874_27390 [Oleomonas cavernae]